jgi:enoyl reductase-like protein
MDNKKEIIEGINKHFQKVYFGRKADGTVVDVQVLI